MRNKWILIYSCLTVLAVYLLFAVCTDKAVRVITENKVLSPVNTVIIDAGHGGTDTGHEMDGVKEKDVALSVSKKIVEYLNSRKDISYKEKVSILEELEFKIDSDGNVTW